MPRTRAVRGKIAEKPTKEKHPSSWLPLTRELSPQATEGENSQPVCSGRFTMVRAISLPPSNPPGLPPPSSEGGKTKNGSLSPVFRPKRRGFTGGTWFRPSDRVRPALRCRNGVSAETPAIEKGSCQGRQALTEGLWVSDRNGLPVTGTRLLHQTYNPSASHSLSTSPYTGEASPA